jgi:hypothetical protein
MLSVIDAGFPVTSPLVASVVGDSLYVFATALDFALVSIHSMSPNDLMDDSHIGEARQTAEAQWVEMKSLLNHRHAQMLRSSTTK